MSKFGRYLIASAVLALCAASSVVGQVVTRVGGTVKDTAEAVVPGAKITLIDANIRVRMVLFAKFPPLPSFGKTVSVWHPAVVQAGLPVS
jgi:hypothetical protein